MNQNNQSIPQRNDEINLRELLLVLWHSKWLISFVTGIFFAFGLVYVMLFETQTATFEVEPVASYEIDLYAELNSLLKEPDVAELTPDLVLTRQTLSDLLMERVRNRQDLLQAVKELNFIPQGNKTDEEWLLAINHFVYNIQFLRPLSLEELAKNKSPNARLNWQIKTEGLRDQIQYKQLLELALRKSNEYVREGLLSKVEQKITLLKNKRTQDIEDIDIKIKILREDYKAKLAIRIAYLKEQAQIARKLAIAKSTIETQSFNGINGMVTTLQTETPFYLRGFEAIEKELDLLETRTTTDEFIPELIELNQKRRVILEDQLPQRLTSALNASNIKSKEMFMSAMFDMDELKFNSKLNRYFLILIFVFSGLTLSSVTVLLLKK